MSGSVLAFALFAAGAAPVPPVPANQAPAPRLVRPELSLIVVEQLPKNENGQHLVRVLRVGIRKNTMLPVEIVWEGEDDLVNSIWPHRLVADRYLVTGSCGVIDLHSGRMIHGETGGQLRHLDAKRFLYCREDGVFSFDFAKAESTRLGDAPKLNHALFFTPSPGGRNMIETGGKERDAFFLHRDGEKPKSLGEGFKMEVNPDPIDSLVFSTPMLWLDDDRFLTQRGNGKLVTVDLDGKVTELLTIKGAGERPTQLSHDASGAVIYSCAAGRFKIDVAKKTAVKSDWKELGHGFETRNVKGRDELRYNGREIATSDELPFLDAKAAPGYLALHAWKGSAVGFIAVWSAATGEWAKSNDMRLGLGAVAGWIK